MHAAYKNTVTMNFLLVFLCKPSVFLEGTLTHALDPVTCLSVKHCPSLRKEGVGSIYCRDPIL